MDMYPVYVLFVIMLELSVALIQRMNGNFLHSRWATTVVGKFFLIFAILQTPILFVWTVFKIF